MARIGQILLLIWKNFKLQFRHPWVTLLELGVPAFFSLILVLIRSTISSEYIKNPVIYDPFSIDSLPANLTPSYGGPKWRILYTPDNNVTNLIMEDVATKLKVNKFGFSNEEDLLEYYSNNTGIILSGIVFENEFNNDSCNQNTIRYKIRPKSAEGGNSVIKNTLSNWFTDFTFPMFPVLGPRNSDSGYGGSPGYMSQGFLPVQHHIAMSIIKYLESDMEKEDNFIVSMRRYPYPPYLDDKFVIALQLFFPMIICFSFIYPAVNIVKNLVVEKEKRIKEAMKMMGLSRWLHWLAWYIKYFIFLLLSCGIITVLLCVKFDQNLAVINTSDPSVIFVWLILYTTSTISFCFLMSTLFSKANSSAAGAGMVFFLTFVPYFFILPRYNTMSYAEKMISCLLPNIGIALGSVVLTAAEASGLGLQWGQLHIPSTPDDSLTMASIFYMFFLDGLICLFLTWYVEAIFPGEYGVPEPWYFPFSRSYWFGPTSNLTDMVQFFDSNVKKSEFFERDPTELMPGIQIQGLTKVFGKGLKPAVNNVNLNMYRSHITVLLGHNGAGKTTTISLLTGLITPTSGTATVNGFDICEEMSSVHSSLGICPQHDILFDELTVKEHLYFFCKLKGYISDLVLSEIERVITALNLSDKQDAQSQTLSGGWKRKLSVAIALVGGSRIVILDEPTSGMDPFNRRSLWDVLQAEKEDRTILLTTHFMEEADVLGDRIAIMADGEIQCCGSPLFLKKRYGAGYHLVMVKDPDCEVPIITDLIHTHVPAAELASNIGSELKYILPHESSGAFFALFSELERRRDELKISGYGASITTMEEVFIKVGRDSTLHENTDIEAQKVSLSPVDSGIHVNSESHDDNYVGIDYISPVPLRRNKGFRLFGQQLYALLEKRILHSYRNIYLTLSQLILSPFFLVLTLLMIKTLPKLHDAPPLVLDVAAYHGTQIPYLVNVNSTQSVALGSLYASLSTEADEPVMLQSTNETILVSYLLKEAVNIPKYNMHNMIAASFGDIKDGESKAKIVSYFNDQAFHSPAVSLLHIDNAILKHVMNESFSFSVTNFPLPRSLGDKGKQQQTQTTVSYQIAQDIMFGMSFLIASFAIFIIKERSSNSKHLQRVSGVNLFSYWLAAFLWDFLNYLIPCCLVLFIFYCFGTEGLSQPEQLGRLFLLFFIHGFSALPFVYCCTFLFMSPSTAYVRLSLFNVLVGIACLLTVTILEIPDLGVEYVAKPLDTTFSIFIPNYSLGRAVNNLYQNYQFNKFCDNPLIKFLCSTGAGEQFEIVKPCCKGKCDSTCIPWEENFLSMTSPGIGQQLVFFVVQSVMFTFLLILCETNFLRILKYKIKNHRVRPTQVPSVEESIGINDVEDDDVRAERLRITNTPLSELFVTNHLVIRELTKYYGSLLAVNKLSFGVYKGECFGLLGLNGAGKTSTFKMITGDESISSGDVYLNGFSIKKATRKVQNRIGYCPQFDALIDQLTGSETLTMFARLRGIAESQIPYQVSFLGGLLGFESHMNKQVKDYSGGNKRKLSTAIALLGNPPVVFLDEPTTGMDPVSRRYMWKALLQVMQTGCSIVLTSHSMEECEALCTRLVIMVNGKLCCLGSSQHLKNKFAEGFSLIIKVSRRPVEPVFHMRHITETTQEPTVHAAQSWLPLNNPVLHDMDEVKAFVQRTFSSAVLKSATENILHYHIPNPQLNWSEIFRAMEEAKMNSLNIEDYSVGETTLEQVFLNFAMVQRDSEAVNC